MRYPVNAIPAKIQSAKAVNLSLSIAKVIDVNEKNNAIKRNFLELNFII